MAMITALVDVRDSNGNSVVLTNPDGTKPTLVLQVGAGFTAAFVKSGDLGVITIGNTTGGEDPAFESVTTTNLVITGSITQGPTTTITGSGTTTGSSSTNVLSLPFPDNSVGSIDVRAVGYVAAGPTIAVCAVGAQSLVVFSGAFDTGGSASSLFSAVGGIPCSIQYAWLSGVLTVTLMGPSVGVTDVEDAGGGATRITCGTGGLTSNLTGTGITITGTGVAGVDGAHAGGTVVQTSSTTFKITGLAYPGGYTSGGTVTLTTAVAITWEFWASLLVKTAP